MVNVVKVAKEENVENFVKIAKVVSYRSVT